MYYVFIENKKFGPCSLDQIKNMNLSRDTLVWKEGLDSWVKAIEIEELTSMFIKSPPSLPFEIQRSIKRNILVKIFIYNFLIGFILSIVFNWIAYLGVMSDHPEEIYSRNEEIELFNELFPISFLVSQSIMLLNSFVGFYKLYNKNISESVPVKIQKIYILLFFILFLSVITFLKVYT